MTNHQRKLFHHIWDIYNDKDMDVEEILIVLLFTCAALSTKENIPMTDLIDVMIENKASIIKELAEQTEKEFEDIRHAQRPNTNNKFELKLVKNGEIEND